MEYRPRTGKDSIINARAERIIVILWLENFHISIEGHENTFALCLSPNDDSTNVIKDFQVSKKPE